MASTMGVTRARSQAPGPMLVLMLLLTLCMTACRGGTDGPRVAQLETDATVLAFGDSLTYGTGTDRDKSYPAVLQTLIGRRIVNAGIPGETTTQGLERLPGVLEDVKPSLVILCLGGNDMLRKHDRAQMKRNLARMIETIRAHGASVVLLGVPEPRLIGLSTEKSYIELATEFELPLESIALPDILGNNSLKSDQIHPNAAGYAQLADAVASLLKHAGAV